MLFEVSSSKASWIFGPAGFGWSADQAEPYKPARNTIAKTPLKNLPALFMILPFMSLVE
jgi:hypothetical protein